jgi:hypothetical protein
VDECGHFYAERDLRTLDYGGIASALERPVGVHVGADAASTFSGQVATLALVNMAARVHRNLCVVAPNAPLLSHGSLATSVDLASACLATARAINPCIELSSEPSPGATSIGLGKLAKESSFYAGSRGPAGWIESQPSGFEDEPLAVIGAGMSACFAAAALFRSVHGAFVRPASFDAWSMAESSSPVGSANHNPLDLGRTLMVGAGAVGSALAYWLREYGYHGEWIIIDGDVVELHNTNRSLAFTAEDAGWPGGVAKKKSDVVAALIRAQSFPDWFANWIQTNGDAGFDTILPLANGPGVRHSIASMGRNVLMHASTSPNWTAELHRHLAGRDDCLDCRMGSESQTTFDCSTGPAPTRGGESGPDTALPFLSAAAGLLLLSGLIRLQEGIMDSGPANHWRVFLNFPRRITQAIPWSCHDGCTVVLPAAARAAINAGTKWASVAGN